MFDIILTNRFRENEQNKKGSMMRNPLKKIGVSALALTLASGSFGAFEFAQGVSAPQNSPSRAAFAPMVGDDSAFAVCVTLDKEQVTGLIDAVLDQFVQVSGANSEPFIKLKGLIEPYKADPFKDAPPDVRSFMKDSGLYDARLQWGVMSCENMPQGDDFKPRGLAIAIAGNVDFERLMAALRKKCVEDPEDAVEITEVTVAGEKAYHFVPQNAATAEKAKRDGLDPYVAWLDGQLAVMAQSLDVLEKQIRLYRSGSRKNSSLVGFSPARGSVARIFCSDFGRLLRQNAKNTRAMTAVIPNGEEILFGLKDFVLDVTASPAGTLGGSIRINAESGEHAEVLRTLAKTGLMVGRAQLAQAPEKPVDLLKVLEAVKVGGVGNSFEISIDTSLPDIVKAVYPFMLKEKGSEEPRTRRSRRQMKSYSDGDLK